MKELPEAPRTSGAIEDVDKVVAVFGPALQYGCVVADDQIADGGDALVLPTDQDNAWATERILDQRLLLAFRVRRHRRQLGRLTKDGNQWMKPDGTPFEIRLMIEGDDVPTLARAGTIIAQQWSMEGIPTQPDVAGPTKRHQLTADRKGAATLPRPPAGAALGGEIADGVGVVGPDHPHATITVLGPPLLTAAPCWWTHRQDESIITMSPS